MNDLANELFYPVSCLDNLALTGQYDHATARLHDQATMRLRDDTLRRRNPLAAFYRDREPSSRLAIG